MIKDYKAMDNIDEILFLKTKVMGVTKAGSPYLTLIFQDKSGTVEAKIWENSLNTYEIPEVGNFVKVEAVVTSYNGTSQLNLKNIEPVSNEDINVFDYCPSTKQDIEDMYKKLMDYIRSVNNEYLHELLLIIFTNENFVKKFKIHSAAKGIHHAYVGGLLEHTLAVTNICNYLSEQYPSLNRNLLITAAILHDIGKVKELSVFPENDYTDRGMLLGHIYLGTEMIHTIATTKMSNFPEKLLSELKHCILAHHGQLEWGSPKTPMLIEALAIHYADNIDAKLRHMSDVLENAEGWSEKSDFILGNKFRPTTYA